jgi:cation diffusion facilitator family transporter
VQPEQQAIKATYISILGNVGLALVKGIAGVFGNSYALIADAIESTSDIFASLLVLFGIRYALRPADKNHPYGHGRAEPLITFIIVAFLIVSSIVITVKSIENIRTPHELPAPYTLIVLAGVIAIKEFFFRKLLHKSKQANSSTLKADAWHHRSDAITSAGAFVGIAIALWFGKGYEAADDWAAILAAAIILVNAYMLFRPALGEIMDEHYYEELVDEIRVLSKEVEGVVDTEKCYVRKTGMSYRVELHVIVNSEITVRSGHDIAHKLKAHLQKKVPQIADVLVHVEPD